MSALRALALAAAVAVAVAWSGVAWGCPVCYGESDSPLIRGAQLSVVFLAVVTYLLITGGVVLFFVLRRRALRQAEAESAAVPS